MRHRKWFWFRHVETETGNRNRITSTPQLVLVPRVDSRVKRLELNGPSLAIIYQHYGSGSECEKPVRRWHFWVTF
jgi:hypothetical protein